MAFLKNKWVWITLAVLGVVWYEMKTGFFRAQFARLKSPAASLPAKK